MRGIFLGNEEIFLWKIRGIFLGEMRGDFRANEEGNEGDFLRGNEEDFWGEIRGAVHDGKLINIKGTGGNVLGENVGSNA